MASGPLTMEQADQSMQEIFGPIAKGEGLLGKRSLELDAKSQAERPNKQGKQPAGTSGKGKGKRLGQGFSRGSRGQESRAQDAEEPTMEDLVRLVARVVIRQEDSLKIIRQSTGWVMFAKTEAPTVIPKLIATSQRWKETVTQPNSPLAGISLRATLMWSITEQILTALNELDTETAEKAQEAGWMNQEQCWVYQKWSPEKKQLIPDPNRVPVKTEALIRLVKELKSLATAEIISALFPSRPLTPNMQGSMVVLMLDVSFRKPAAHRFYDILEDLQGQAALQLCGIQLRKEGYKRSAAVQKLSDMLR